MGEEEGYRPVVPYRVADKIRQMQRVPFRFPDVALERSARTMALLDHTAVPPFDPDPVRCEYPTFVGITAQPLESHATLTNVNGAARPQMAGKPLHDQRSPGNIQADVDGPDAA